MPEVPPRLPCRPHCSLSCYWFSTLKGTIKETSTWYTIMENVYIIHTF
jgi:hypothetical protein